MVVKIEKKLTESSKSSSSSLLSDGPNLGDDNDVVINFVPDRQQAGPKTNMPLLQVNSKTASHDIVNWIKDLKGRVINIQKFRQIQ